MDAQNLQQETVRMVPMGILCPVCSREGEIIHEDSRGQILFCKNVSCRVMEYCDSYDTKHGILGKKKEQNPNKTLENIL